MDVILRCATCYPVRLGNCPNSLIFNIAIDPNTTYNWEISDSMGNIYEGSTTTDGSGNISIATSTMPFDAYPGLFNKFAGSFKITFYDTVTGEAVPFTVSGTQYTCIAFSMKDTVEVDSCGEPIDCGCIFGAYGAPSDLVGTDGDFYIDSGSGVIWEKTGGTWTVFYVPVNNGGTLTGANNGLHLDGTDVQLGVNPLIEDTTISAGTFDFQVTGVPKANQTTIFESSQDLFGLQALVGQSINGQGMKYNLTYDINGDPESWVFVKVADDTNVGGGYNATIGYTNLATGEESYCEATPTAINMLVNNGGLPAGISIDRATEKLSIGMNGSERLTIDATETKLPPFAGGGTQMLTVDNNGVVGVATAPTSSALVFMDSFTTVSSSNGLGISADGVYFGSILIPANTVQNGDIIEVETIMTSNGAGTGGAIWALRSGDAAPLAATLTPGSIDANGFASYVAYVNTTGVYHCGMKHELKATTNGFIAVGSSTVGASVLSTNCIINVHTYQSTNIAAYTDNTMLWNADRYIVFFHRSAAATVMTHHLSTVKIYRP